MRRSERNEKRKASARKRLGRSALTLLFVVVGIAVVIATVWAVGSALKSRPEPAVALSDEVAAVDSGVARVAGPVPTAGAVEVPDLVGLTLEEARIVLEAAGLRLESAAAQRPDESADGSVVEQQSPPPGTLAKTGDSVVLGLVSAASKARAAVNSGWVVCIDPGHQAREDQSPEPLGPGAKATKQAATAGTTGVATDIPEYELTLQLAMNLKNQLEARGVRVVLTRSVNDVSLSNSERATIANRAGADLFIRLHGNGSPDQGLSGVATLYPAVNRWTRPIAARSRSAAQNVQRAVIASTKAKNLSTVARGDMVGFNHSKVPAILVECGFLSNPVEDRLLASPHYQDKLCAGLADGAIAYLESQEGR